MLAFPATTVPYVNGRSLVTSDFVKRRGPRDGRAVIRRIDIVTSVRLTTGAGVTLSKRDLCGIFKLIELYDAGGLRRSMDGYHAKIWMQDDLGERAPEDDADVAANTANQDRTVILSLCFQRPTDFAPDDFGLTADDFLGGYLALTWAADADLSWAGGAGAGTIVAANTSAQVIAYYEEEGDTQFKSRDLIQFVEMETNAKGTLPIDGGLVDGAFIHKRDTTGANAGGVAVTTLTSVEIPALNQPAIPRAALRAGYLIDRGGAYTDGNMVDLNVAQPLFWQQPGAKMRHRIQIPANLILKLVSTMAAGRITYRTTEPKSVKAMQAAAVANGLPPDAPVRVKTRGKSQRGLKGWKGGDKFLPTKIAPAGG